MHIETRRVEKATVSPEAIACAEDWRPLRSEGDGGGGLLGDLGDLGAVEMMELRAWKLLIRGPRFSCITSSMQMSIFSLSRSSRKSSFSAKASTSAEVAGAASETNLTSDLSMLSTMAEQTSAHL